MRRRSPILGILLLLAGCGDERATRLVPVTPTSSAPDNDDGAAPPVTKAPRAIATH